MVLWNFIGYKCEQHDNPADFFLDIVFQSESENQEGDETMMVVRMCVWWSYLVIMLGVKNDGEKAITGNKLALAYKESSQFNEISSELSLIRFQEVTGHKQYAKFSTSFFWQVNM